MSKFDGCCESVGGDFVERLRGVCGKGFFRRGFGFEWGGWIILFMWSECSVVGYIIVIIVS